MSLPKDIFDNRLLEIAHNLKNILEKIKYQFDFFSNLIISI